MVKFAASPRDSRADLVRRLSRLHEVGFVCVDGWDWVFDYAGDFEHVPKDALVEAIRAMEPPGDVFGHDEVLVEKDPVTKRWKIRTAQGADLCVVAWTAAKDWERLAMGANGASMLSALDAAMLADPLTGAEWAEVDRARPDLARNARWVPDQDAWEGTHAEPVDPTPSPMIQPRQPPVVTEAAGRTLSATRKITL